MQWVDSQAPDQIKYKLLIRVVSSGQNAVETKDGQDIKQKAYATLFTIYIIELALS